MASAQRDVDKSILDLLSQIQASNISMQNDYRRLAASVDALDGKVNTFLGIKQVQEAATNSEDPRKESAPSSSTPAVPSTSSPPIEPRASIDMERPSKQYLSSHHVAPSSSPNRSVGTSRIILTTYPGQSGIDPFPMEWGNPDHKLRGPVVVSRNSRTVRRRNGRSWSSLTFFAHG